MPSSPLQVVGCPARSGTNAIVRTGALPRCGNQGSRPRATVWERSRTLATCDRGLSSTGHSSSHGEVVTASHQHRQSEQRASRPLLSCLQHGATSANSALACLPRFGGKRAPEGPRRMPRIGDRRDCGGWAGRDRPLCFRRCASLGPPAWPHLSASRSAAGSPEPSRECCSFVKAEVSGQARGLCSSSRPAAISASTRTPASA